MNPLDSLISTPGLVEVNAIDVAAPPERVWERIRHFDLGESALARLLFGLRTAKAPKLCLDALRSSSEVPGFQILIDDAPHVIAVGGIGKVWKLDIPFVHIADAAAFAAYDAPGEIKVAWSMGVEALENGGSRVAVEVRVSATDDASWKKFRKYFALVGPASRLIRRLLLARLERELGPLAQAEEALRLPGDELLATDEQATQAITVNATPEVIWPWLVQMGCNRAGFYALDSLDNGGQPSAREVHPEWQAVRVGDTVAATPNGDEGFEVRLLVPACALVLGATRRDGERYWSTTWAFVLVPLDAERTRLVVRARVQYAGERLPLAWLRPVHHLMELIQLRNLAARAEGRLPRDTLGDVSSGLAGAALMLGCLATPFRRNARSRWGVTEAEADAPRPGDDLVSKPRWKWTHAVEIDADASDVWPWLAQMGADRAGFYSYQFLENLAGCNIRNAETLHPEWQVREGGTFSLHPKMPPLKVVLVLPGRGFVAHAAPDESTRARGERWAAVSWAFFVDAVAPGRCRVVSRYRCKTSDDLVSELSYRPTLIEPIGFAMDRRMLLGLKERATRSSQHV